MMFEILAGCFIPFVGFVGSALTIYMFIESRIEKRKNKNKPSADTDDLL